MLHKKVISEPYFAIHIINFYSLPRENAFSSTPKNSLMYLLPRFWKKSLYIPLMIISMSQNIPNAQSQV